MFERYSLFLRRKLYTHTHIHINKKKINIIKNIFLFLSIQREEQEYFMKLGKQLCVIYAKVKIVKIYVSQNLANKRIMLQYPLRLIFILVYIYN